MSSVAAETCSKCGRRIPRSEHACVFKGMIVCTRCDRELRSSSGLRPATPAESQCGWPDSQRPYEREKKESISHMRKKIVLLVVVASVLAICIALYYLRFCTNGSSSSTTGTSVGKSEPAGWPFETKIPNGFEFDHREEGEGRTFWILKGRQFGQAQDILIVVRTTPECFGEDLMRAPYWAAELSVGLSVGETALSQEQVGETEKYALTTRPELINQLLEKYALTIYPDLGNQILVSPLQQRKKPEERKYGVVAGIRVLLPPVDFDIPGTSPKIQVDNLGKPADFVPGFVSAWAGHCEGTVLLAAWAGEWADFYSPNDNPQRRLAELCHSLRREQGFRVPDPKTVDINAQK